ncbi:unnamed protein product [Nezara viridula]|uniref:Uncharacterized protein n=1 Tax=Nezara viridula TaxID=85310 RepID=A0A9P0MNV6_NEZVI|nr:unnamed protein product [Nezara viridula]
MITEATMAPFAGIRHSGIMAINMVFQATMVSVAFAAFRTQVNLLARLCRVPPRSEVEGGGVRPPTSSLEDSYINKIVAKPQEGVTT